MKKNPTLCHLFVLLTLYLLAVLSPLGDTLIRSATAQSIGQGYRCSNGKILKSGRAIPLKRAKNDIQQKIRRLGTSPKNAKKRQNLKSVVRALTACSRNNGAPAPAEVISVPRSFFHHVAINKNTGVEELVIYALYISDIDPNSPHGHCFQTSSSSVGGQYIPASFLQDPCAFLTTGCPEAVPGGKTAWVFTYSRVTSFTEQNINLKVEEQIAFLRTRSPEIASVRRNPGFAEGGCNKFNS